MAWSDSHPIRLAKGCRFVRLRVRERIGGQDVLKVTGTVANVVQSREPLPTLRITLFDTADRELQWVTVPPALKSLDQVRLCHSRRRFGSSPDARLLRVGFVASPN